MPIVYITMKALTVILGSLSSILFTEKKTDKWWLFPAFLLFLCAMWLPYLPSYWPGGVYTDTLDSINMALGKAQWDNHHPVLYSLIWKVMFAVTGAFSEAGEYPGLKLFTVVQLLLSAVAIAFFLYWCRRQGIHKKVTAVLLLFGGVFPLIPLYGISLWKDTIFSLIVFLYAVFLYQLFSEYRRDIRPGQLVLYGIFSVLIIFLRNNGFYVILFCSFIITLFCVRRRKRIAKKIGILSLAILIVSGIIQNPVYNRLGYNTYSTRESLGIPIQQTAYILATDGKTTAEDIEFLSEIMPIDNWRSLYDPTVSDTIKFDPSFSNEFLDENESGFMKVYCGMVLRNPVKAFKAYLLSTLGFWDITESSSVAYVSNFSLVETGYCMSDYFDYYLHFSFKDLVEPHNYLSASCLVWLMLFTVVVCIKKHKYYAIMTVLPTLGIWITIMIATPIAFSFRYVYSLFLCVPLYLFTLVKVCGEEK